MPYSSHIPMFKVKKLTLYKYEVKKCKCHLCILFVLLFLNLSFILVSKSRSLLGAGQNIDICFLTNFYFGSACYILFLKH